MLAAIGVVTAIAWWDSRRESEAIFRDLGTEQSLVAAIAARDLAAHLAALRENPSLGLHLQGADDAANSQEVRPEDLLGNPASLEQPGEFRLFLAPPNEPSLMAMDGSVVSSAAVRAALEHGLDVFRLDRAQARAIGLVARTAMAGLARVDGGSLGRWGVVAVATAARQRDREDRAFWRFVLGVGVATGLVLAFGGAALRTQRRELQAQRELAVAAVEHQRDEQLSRAQRVATMGTFAMGIVHEVSTPLGIIMGRAEQIRARAADGERNVLAAQAILGQVDRIQTIVRRFLDMARGGRPSLSRTNAAELVRAAAASVQHRFAKASVLLVTDTSQDVHEVQCDRALLEQAIVNLLLNACEACAPGGHVELALRSDGERVAFVVTDDGVGISSDSAKRATDPFFTTKTAGTGFGLAIASEIAKSHRGDLSIGPHGERGTRACVEIPAVISGGAHA
ncbi:MAG TPA: HAMP domain-containing sensor histidine kinase [Polyangiaceae bacterium]|nr:HAMP domain-containing sensor histidine kinase [Polyangiaceae bacterium]